MEFLNQIAKILSAYDHSYAKIEFDTNIPHTFRILLKTDVMRPDNSETTCSSMVAVHKHCSPLELEQLLFRAADQLQSQVGRARSGVA